MSQNLRDKIRGLGIKKELVKLSDDLTVEVRGMNGHHRADLIDKIGGGRKANYRELYPEILAATVFDPETGEAVFAGAEREDILELDSAVLESMVLVALRLAGLDEKAEGRLGKNS